MKLFGTLWPVKVHVIEGIIALANAVISWMSGDPAKEWRISLSMHYGKPLHHHILQGRSMRVPSYIGLFMCLHGGGESTGILVDSVKLHVATMQYRLFGDCSGTLDLSETCCQRRPAW